MNFFIFLFNNEAISTMVWLVINKKSHNNRKGSIQPNPRDTFYQHQSHHRNNKKTHEKTKGNYKLRFYESRSIRIIMQQQTTTTKKKQATTKRNIKKISLNYSKISDFVKKIKKYSSFCSFCCYCISSINLNVI